MPSIYDQLIAEAAEWRKGCNCDEVQSDVSSPPCDSCYYADELEALAKQVCAEAREAVMSFKVECSEYVPDIPVVSKSLLVRGIIGGPQTENPPQPSGQGG